MTTTINMYSFNGKYPQELPNYWRNNPQDEIINILELNDEELSALGWKGPIQMPPTPNTSYFIHDYEWNSETSSFDAIEICDNEKRRRVNYLNFSNLLMSGKLDPEITNPTIFNCAKGPYYKIKMQAAQSLKINVIATEFISLLSDAKNGNANIPRIQDSIFQIIENVNFTQEDITELQDIFTKSGMFSVYTLELPPEYVNKTAN